MHDRNIYKTPPNFKQLAERYPEFRSVARKKESGIVQINFKDVNTLRILTKCLLHKDFNLNVEIPEKFLIPTIPSRLNYILLIEDIIQKNFNCSNNEILGLDIGTGPCCIYPLLAYKQCGWKFVATEKNHQSFQLAEENVQHNSLDGFIKDIFIDAMNAVTDMKFTFSMCNPPFFETLEETESMYKSRTHKRSLPSSVSTGKHDEKVIEGGEVQFICRMIDDSQKCSNQFCFFTSLVGQKKSICKVVEYLKLNNIPHFDWISFSQGQTTRWIICWTWVNNLKLFDRKSKRNIKPMQLIFPKELVFKEVCTYLLQILQNLEIKVERTFVEQSTEVWYLEIYTYAWQHQRRKRRLLLKEKEQKDFSIPAQNLQSNVDSSLSFFPSNIKENSITKPLLKCNLTIIPQGLKLKSLSDNGSHDLLHQLLQYLRNQLFNLIKNKS